mmetsp:Transcript_44779/g.87770  ORF Transcript_44779/g.87770 Transcript_44779/m.87770 type:complete len:290 (+) Transcript_44779:46-915(+)
MSSTSKRKEEEKIASILREVRMVKANKSCLDCGAKGATTVVCNTNTFVCTECSGIHREINHRIKSISMSTFSMEEVLALQAGGNSVGKKYWLATFGNSGDVAPDPSLPAAVRQTKIRDFIRAVYVYKQYVSKDKDKKKKKKKDKDKEESEPEEEVAKEKKKKKKKKKDKIDTPPPESESEEEKEVVKEKTKKKKREKEKQETVESEPDIGNLQVASESEEETEKKKKKKKPVVVACFDHKGEEDDELDMVKGDRIVVLKKDPDGWWLGRNERTNGVGLFPYNYVKDVPK